eukprot:TRINITY_DN1318_c1_g1_i1.p1 TRINITY_DN1318_c1_g1~~TRINITY_DN1318_c1_g1_i1.p1  ORF type:complete len:215 (-),score=-29.80 TRINITY_DN1318_c1_g1_i1:252-896(-)
MTILLCVYKSKLIQLQKNNCKLIVKKKGNIIIQCYLLVSCIQYKNTKTLTLTVCYSVKKFVTSKMQKQHFNMKLQIDRTSKQFSIIIKIQCVIFQSKQTIVIYEPYKINRILSYQITINPYHFQLNFNQVQAQHSIIYQNYNIIVIKSTLFSPQIKNRPIQLKDETRNLKKFHLIQYQIKQNQNKQNLFNLNFFHLESQKIFKKIQFIFKYKNF